jgi:hypothetical protein
MINIRRFFENHFDTNKISDDSMRTFTEILIQNLAANNDKGQYTRLIAMLSKAYNEYLGAMVNEDTNMAIQKSLTKSKDNLVKLFSDTISQKEGIVRGHFGTDTPEYLEFFPKGLSEYNHANMGNIETLMSRMVNASAKHAEILGQDFADLFQDIKDRFTTVRTAQLQKLGEVSGNKVTTSTVRDELEICLGKTVLTLALEYFGKPDEGMKFFDQSVL